MCWGTMKGFFTSHEVITGSSRQDLLDKKQPAHILRWEAVSGGRMKEGTGPTLQWSRPGP